MNEVQKLFQYLMLGTEYFSRSAIISKKIYLIEVFFFVYNLNK